MVGEAEKYAEEDKARREAVDTKNQVSLQEQRNHVIRLNEKLWSSRPRSLSSSSVAHMKGFEYAHNEMQADIWHLGQPLAIQSHISLRHVHNRTHVIAIVHLCPPLSVAVRSYHADFINFVLNPLQDVSSLKCAQDPSSMAMLPPFWMVCLAQIGSARCCGACQMVCLAQIGSTRCCSTGAAGGRLDVQLMLSENQCAHFFGRPAAGSSRCGTQEYK